MSSQTANTHPSRPTSGSSSPTGTAYQPSSDWTAGVIIDDADITFNGQPLSALYEQTRYRYIQCSPGREQQPEERGRKRDRES